MSYPPPPPPPSGQQPYTGLSDPGQSGAPRQESAAGNRFGVFPVAPPLAQFAANASQGTGAPMAPNLLGSASGVMSNPAYMGANSLNYPLGSSVTPTTDNSRGRYIPGQQGQVAASGFVLPAKPPSTQPGMVPPAASQLGIPHPSVANPGAVPSHMPGGVRLASVSHMGMPGGGAPPPPYSGNVVPLAPNQPATGLGGFDQAASVVTQFQTLTLGVSGHGHQTDVSIDPGSFPRPSGELHEQAAAAPPLQNKANCDPKFMRLTCNAIPNSSQLRGRWSMPLGVIVHPLAGEPDDVPVIGPDSAGIVRCRRCRTYINPFVQWSDGGRRFRCNVCGMINEVPVEYFCTLDNDGRRRDADERPELAKGSAEYVAPAEYMVRPPMPPVFFFVIDVSYAAVSSGMVLTACQTIKDSLDSLPGGSRTQVGFITFDSVLHFYNLKSTLSQPQQMIVAEVDDPFIPIPDDLLVNLSESRSVVDSLLDSLPASFEGNTQVDSCMGPALKAAFMVQSHIGGKLLLFQAAVPSIGPGKIKNRESAALYGTDREHTLRIPEDPFFKKFSAECSRVQITVDIFVFCNMYCDLASLSSLPKYTCGQVYYYPGFNSQRDGAKLKAELQHNLSRLTGWEAVMRIRCSKGLKISSFHGHFFIRSTDLLAMPTVDPDKCFAVQISHEEAIVTGSVAYIQCALLYTASCGERRIRVHTMTVQLVSDMSEMFKSIDCGALACMLGKLGVEKSYGSRLDDTRQALQTKTVNLLKEFRGLNAGQFRAPHKMILPDSAQLLPLYTLGLIKVAALRGSARDVNADERIAVGFEMMASAVQQMAKLIYPNLYPVFDMTGDWGTVDADGSVVVPSTVPLNMEQLSGEGAYLMDNGRLFILWLGRNIPSGYIGELFAADPSTLAHDLSGVTIEPEKQTEVSRRICKLLRKLRMDNWLYQQCFVVRQGSAMEAHVIPYFVEDRGQAMQSYTDFLCSVHKGISLIAK